MNRTKFVLILGLLLGFFTAPLGAANPPKATAKWDNLKTLAPGDNIRVVLNDKKSYRGKLQSLTDNAIVVRLATGEQSFKRTDILRVSAKGQPHRLRNALIGAAVGAAVIGGASAAQTDEQIYTLVFAVPGGAALGAVGGAFVPTGGWHEVYRAR